jgi:hypothetical protein
MDDSPDISSVFGNLTSLSLFFFISLIFFYAVLTGCSSACSLLAISIGNHPGSHLVCLHMTLALTWGTLVLSAVQKRILDVTGQKFIHDMNTVFAEDPRGGAIHHANLP